MKKSVFAGILCISLTLLSACGHATFNGSSTGNDTQFIMEYSVLNASDHRELSLKTGDVIDTVVVSDDGSVDIQVENSAGEAFIKSAIVRKKGDKVTYVLGVSRGAGEVASAWAAREKLSCNALYVDFDREGEGGLASVSDGTDIKSAISEGTLTAGSGLDLYGKREQVSEIIAALAEKYDRIIISGYTAADARSELVGALADDTVLVVDEGFAVKKLIRLEEKYKAEGRSVEGVILRKKNSRRQGR